MDAREACLFFSCIKNHVAKYVLVLELYGTEASKQEIYPRLVRYVGDHGHRVLLG